MQSASSIKRYELQAWLAREQRHVVSRENVDFWYRFKAHINQKVRNSRIRVASWSTQRSMRRDIIRENMDLWYRFKAQINQKVRNSRIRVASLTRQRTATCGLSRECGLLVPVRRDIIRENVDFWYRFKTQINQKVRNSRIRVASLVKTVPLLSDASRYYN